MGIWLPGGHNPAEKIVLTPKQSNIYCHGWHPQYRFRTVVAGRRFGKSFLAIREMKRAARLAARWNVNTDEEIWLGAPTFKQGKRVSWPRLKRAIPRHWIETRREDECMIRMKTGHTLRIVGLDNYDDLRGSGLFFFIGDEWKDANPLCWSEVIQPMLATSKGHALKIGTPGGYDHFFDDYQRGQPGAIDSEGDLITDTKSWKYSTAEGGNVSQEEIERNRREKDPLTFQQEFFADFVSFSGRVVYAFDRSKNIRPCNPVPINSTIHIGMDFNINPMSATCWYEADGKSYQFDEIILKTSDTEAMAKEICKRYGRTVPGGKFKVDHITIYPDPAGAQRRTSAQGKTDISILRDHGLKVIALSSHPLVRDRINTTNARFENAAGENRAFVDPKCVESIRAYERLTYKDDTNEPDKGSGFDHPVDATGYYFYTRFGGSGVGKMRITGI